MSKLLESFLGLDRDGFLAEHPYSLVVTDNPGETVDNVDFHTIASDPGAESGTDHARLLERVGKWAFLLRKKGRFASMLTVGRAANSDLRLNVPSVSKFHAYFTHVAREKSWYLSDANSSNGTFVAGKEIPPSHGKVKLEPGQTLRFGPDVTCQFLTAEALWNMFSERVTDTPPNGMPPLQDTPASGEPVSDAALAADSDEDDAAREPAKVDEA